MKNKVLVRIWVPELDANFDLFIPVNEIIWKVKLLIVKSVCDLCNASMYDKEKTLLLINKDNNRMYQSNEIVINTDIRNGTELLLFTKIGV